MLGNLLTWINFPKAPSLHPFRILFHLYLLQVLPPSSPLLNQLTFIKNKIKMVIL